MLFHSTAHARQTALAQVNILAEPSLSIPLTLIARDYGREHGVAVSNAFADTFVQSVEIVEEGVEADIFITTDEEVIQNLKNQGVVDVYSQTAIAKNRLVLATNKNNHFKLEQGSAIEQIKRYSKDFTFAIGDPEFLTVGQYALPTIQSLGWYDALQAPLNNPMLFVFNDRDMHHAVETQNGYGILFASDVKRNPSLRVLELLDESNHAPIRYYAVVIAGENMDSARAFMEYLSGESAQAIFKKTGFETP